MLMFRLRPLLRVPNRATLRVLVISGVIAALLVVIMTLIFNIRNLLSTLERTGLDNSQWVTVQTEVEVLNLARAIATARIQPAPQTAAQPDLLRWFNVLVSRVALLTEGPLYEDFFAIDKNARNLGQLQDFITAWVPVVDGPPAALNAALPRMQAEVAALIPVARGLSVAALQEFHASTDSTRAGLDRALTRLALITVTGVVLLVVLVTLLMRASVSARDQGRENRLTGARLQVVIATSPDAIVVTNRGGWVLEFNPAAEAMFGFTRDQMLGREATRILFAPEHRAPYREVLVDALADVAVSGARRLELEGLRADGSRFALEVSFAIRDLTQDGMIVAFLRDISSSKAAEAVVRDALAKARMGESAKARFIAVMSHEMRTPLNGLLGSMGLLRDTGLSADQTEMLRVMEVSGEALLDHVNAVLDLTMAEAGVPRPAHQPFDLDRLIADCLASQAGLARNAGTTLAHMPLGGAIGLVQGDAGFVRQVLLNLIGNAVKFTAQGTITVESERLPPGGGSDDSGLVEVRVIDTGIGIAAADLDRVFQDFETTSTTGGFQGGGSGLGLGIARHLVAAMHGEIGAESEPGGGSVFWLRLPLPPVGSATPLAPPGIVTTATTHTPPPATTLTILIIEDNQINRFVLRRHLEAAGHSVTEAVDGREGVALADRHAFDLVVTDMAMPHIDGIAAARLIRTGGGASAQARIVLLTAYPHPAPQASLDAAGIEACLIKPVSRTTLLAQVQGQPQPAAPQGSTAPVLDPSTLNEMQTALGADVVAGLVARLLADGDATLAAAPVAPDRCHMLHQMAGGCALFGAAQMHRALIEAEQALHTAPSDQVTIILAGLAPVWAQTRAALSRYAAPSAA